jgi:hypothetical protein
MAVGNRIETCRWSGVGFTHASLQEARTAYAVTCVLRWPRFATRRAGRNYGRGTGIRCSICGRARRPPCSVDRPPAGRQSCCSAISSTGHFLSFAESSKIASKRSRAFALGMRTDDPETTFSPCTTLNVGQRSAGRERSGILSGPWGTAGGICRTRLANPHARHLLHRTSNQDTRRFKRKALVDWLKPLRNNEPSGSVSAASPRAAQVRRSINTCPPWASSARREARLTTLPIAE